MLRAYRVCSQRLGHGMIRSAGFGQVKSILNGFIIMMNPSGFTGRVVSMIPQVGSYGMLKIKFTVLIILRKRKSDLKFQTFFQAWMT